VSVTPQEQDARASSEAIAEANAAAAATPLAAEPAPRNSREARQRVEQARERLVTTVGELGNALDQTKQDAVRRAKRIAPIAGAAVAGLIALKIARRR